MRFKVLLIALLLLTSDLFAQNVLVSKDPSRSYTNWLLSLDSFITVKEFYALPKDSLEFYLKWADGMLLTGGEDVNPKMYGKAEYVDQCEKPDDYRDSIEKVMILYGLDHGKALLGICRGQQLINVVAGGTLIPDLPTRNPQSQITHRSNLDSAHIIKPTEGSWIDHYTIVKDYWVNSRHHQAIDQLAPGFKVSAQAIDGVIESIEYLDSSREHFIIAVQWHPENLRDKLASVLGDLYLKAMREK